ncbi:MAG: transcriptional repressor NrdR [Parcubacteria group bacterium]|nr:transcriptional repressor NrdR [Parcubacteria group bacterium]
MKCPSCDYEETRVLDSRLAELDNTVRRRRECGGCGFRFSTREETEILNLSVIKRDGRTEAYSREKLAAGLSRALEKRPVASSEFRTLQAAIERDISVLNRSEIKASQIGDIAMRHLKKLDKVAYIRFASVYREFRDVHTLYDEINKLVGKAGRTKKRATHAKRRNKPKK